MNVDPNSALALIDLIRRKAPEYLDLLTARSEHEFETAFNSILEIAVMHLESNKKHYSSLNEEGLTSVFAAAIRVPGLDVKQETHSNGHVDITIELSGSFPARKKLGEAKVYRGPKYHIDAIEQLLGRYTTGRESGGLLLVYFRSANISNLVLKLRERLNADRPFAQSAECTDHVMKWSFVSVHHHKCGDDLNVSHIGINLYS